MASSGDDWKDIDVVPNHEFDVPKEEFVVPNKEFVIPKEEFFVPKWLNTCAG